MHTYAAAFQDNSDSKRCSQLLSKISYFWKLDSLANNGFRAWAGRDLRLCEIDSISEENLLRALGKADKVETVNNLRFLSYRTYDYRRMDAVKWDGPMSIVYIIFTFDKGLLTEIGVGSRDLK